MRDWDANLRNELYTEYNLDANTKHEFQIRCKLTHPRSLWSRWSESTVYLTPEKGEFHSFFLEHLFQVKEKKIPQRMVKELKPP